MFKNMNKTKRRSVIIVSLSLLLITSLVSGAFAVQTNSAIKVGSSSFGKIIVNIKGMSAYYYDLDKAKSGVSACSGQCAVNWPAIISSISKPKIAGITGTVGTIATKKGRQVTINGRPIYTFAYDSAPGSVSGQGSQGVWYLVNPTGKEIKSLTPVTKPTTTPNKTSPYPKSNY